MRSPLQGVLRQGCVVALPPTMEVSKLDSLSLSQTYAHSCLLRGVGGGVAHVFQRVKLLCKLAMDQGEGEREKGSVKNGGKGGAEKNCVKLEKVEHLGKMTLLW